MSASLVRIFAAALAAAVIGSAVSFAAAQPASEQKPQDQSQKPATQQNDAAKDEKKKIDEFAEAARLLSGGAGNPECVWLGRRVVNLLWRDDLDTAGNFQSVETFFAAVACGCLEIDTATL